MNKWLHIAFFALSLPLWSQSGPRVEVAAGVDRPYGELAHHEYLGCGSPLGFNLAAGLVGRFGTREAWRAHVTYHHFQGQRWKAVDQANDYDILQLGGDWIHGLESLDRDIFFLLGGHVSRFKAAYDGPLLHGSQSQSGALGVRLGGGYAFSRAFRLEGSYNQSQLKRYGSDGLGFTPAIWVQVSAIFQF